MTEALRALKIVADSARALLDGRRRDLEELDAHIEQIKKMASPLREGPLEKLLARRTDLAAEVARAQQHSTEIEQARDLVQRLVDDLSHVAEKAADEASAREAKLHDLRLTWLKREQELQETIDSRDHELRTVREQSGEEVAKAKDRAEKSEAGAKNLDAQLVALRDLALKAEHDLNEARAQATAAVDEVIALKSGAGAHEGALVALREENEKALAAARDAHEKAMKEARTESERARTESDQALAAARSESAGELKTLRESAAELTKARAELLALRASTVAGAQDLTALREAVTRAKDELAALRAEHERALADVVAAQARQAESSAAVTRVNDELAMARADVANAREALAGAKDELAKAHALTKTHEDALAKGNDELAKLRDDLAKLKEESARAESAITKAHDEAIAKLNEELVKARDDAAQAKDALGKGSDELTKARADAARAEGDVAKASEELAQAREEIVLQKIDVAKARDEIKKADGELAKAREAHTSAAREVSELKQLVEVLTTSSTRPTPVPHGLTPPAGTPKPEFETLSLDESADRSPTPHKKTTVFSKEAVRQAAARDEAIARGELARAEGAHSESAPSSTPASEPPRTNTPVIAQGAAAIPRPPGLPPPPPLASDGAPNPQAREAPRDDSGDGRDLPPPETRVRATPTLDLALFTDPDDARFAAGMPKEPTSIAEIARTLDLDIAAASRRIAELVSVGLVEIQPS